MKVLTASVSVLFPILALTGSAMAQTCLDQKNIDEAYKGQVEAALVSAGLKAVVRTNINASVTVDQSPHDPEYNVLLSTGGVAHVTCDDSGDDDCGCEVMNIADLQNYKGDNGSALSNLTPGTQALPSDAALTIKTFLQQCAVHVENSDEDFGTQLKPGCSAGDTSAIDSYDKITGLDTLTISTMKGEYLVFGYDNTNSDGGDLTDVGVYDQNGSRIGYQVAPFLLSNSLDSLAALVGLDSSQFTVTAPAVNAQ